MNWQRGESLRANQLQKEMLHEPMTLFNCLNCARKDHLFCCPIERPSSLLNTKYGITFKEITLSVDNITSRFDKCL